MEFKTEVIDIIERVPHVKSFRFKRPENAEFTPGQYFILTIDVGGEPQSKPFSFSSSPTEEGYLEFTKRITESDFSKTLDGMEKGAAVKVKMPYGNFTLHNAGGGKIAFLSGGIGITPIRSMCKYATDKGLPTDMALLYGCNDEECIVFREDFDRMRQANKNLRVIYTLACPVGEGWKGCCGFIDKAMIEREVPDFADRLFYVCGPPGMVTCLTEALKAELAVPEERIRVEHFHGYK